MARQKAPECNSCQGYAISVTTHEAIPETSWGNPTEPTEEILDKQENIHTETIFGTCWTTGSH